MKRRNIIKSTLAVLFLSLSIVVTYLPASMITYATDGSDYGETVATLEVNADESVDVFETEIRNATMVLQKLFAEEG
jgi:hypothetical protein